MTTQSVARRAQALSGTGTVGKWEVEAVFCCRSPKKDEQKVHAKLARYRFNKEYFRLSAALATNKVRSKLCRDPF